MGSIFKNWVFGNKRAWAIYCVILAENGLNANKISVLSEVEYKTTKRILSRLEEEGLVESVTIVISAKRKSTIYRSSIPNKPKVEDLNARHNTQRNAKGNAEDIMSNNQSYRLETPKYKPTPIPNETPNLDNSGLGNTKRKSPSKQASGDETARLFEEVPPSLDISNNKEETKKKKRGTQKWRDRPIKDLDFTGKVFHIYDRINAEHSEKEYGEVRETAGNWGKAGGHIKRHEKLGFKSLREIEASIKYWYSLSGHWEDGHFIDRWAGQIPAMIDGAKREGFLKKQRKKVDPAAVHSRDKKRLKEMGLPDEPE